MRVPYKISGRVADIQKTVVPNRYETIKVFIKQEFNINVGDILTDNHGNSGIVVEISDRLSNSDIVANFPLGNIIKRTRIAEKEIIARSVGLYRLCDQPQQPIGNYDGKSIAQRITYNDLVKLQNAGLMDAYQNMLIFQSKNPEQRESLLKNILNGKGSDTFTLPYFDLNKIHAFLAAVCIDLVFIDKDGNEVLYSSVSRGHLEKLCYSGEISLRLRALTDDRIRMLSHGLVTRNETINHRTGLPERDGLFCPKIFGPEIDWECYCRKFRRKRYKGSVCDNCGVEVTRSVVRYERMGHIELAIPIEHPLFEGVLLNSIPVLPPELRPIIPLKNHQYHTADLNYLYQSVINRNNRLVKYKELGGSPSLIANEIGLLIESVNALFFGAVNDERTSLFDHIRELMTMNIKSEPLDYSASCGICVDDSVTDNECGLPKEIALELFKPFIIHKLIEQKLYKNIKSAEREVERCIIYGEEETMMESIVETLQDLMSKYQIILLGEEKTGELLLLTPKMSKNKVLTVNSKNYTNLKIDIDKNVRLFLPATDTGQALCKHSFNKRPMPIDSLFNVEKETDFIKDLARESMFGDGKVEKIIQEAANFKKECSFKSLISRLIFGVPQHSSIKEFYALPDFKEETLEKLFSENINENEPEEPNDVFDLHDTSNLGDQFNNEDKIEKIYENLMKSFEELMNSFEVPSDDTTLPLNTDISLEDLASNTTFDDLFDDPDNKDKKDK